MRTALLIAGIMAGSLTAFTLRGEEVSPLLMQVKVHDYYKYRPDGEAGRSVTVSCQGDVSLKGAKIEIWHKTGSETLDIPETDSHTVSLLLRPNIGVERTDTVIATLIRGDERVSQQVIVPAMRHWTVYIYPHSHVDIGYTNTHENVELIHKRNLDVAMDLAEQTADYPEDARFRWNPEVMWPVERYLNSEDPKKRKRLLEAIRKGQIALDAGYVNTNTSASSDEELLQLFHWSKAMEQETGQPVRTMVQVDIPGMSWGVVTAARQMGVNYVLSLFNGSDRTGWTHELSFRPFWWLGPDGKSKVLFLQPGDYTPGAKAKGYMYWPKMAGQTDPSKLIPVVRTEHPREHFVDAYLANMLPKLERDKHYLYDIFPMTWCMADNTPIDADLPDAVKSWNEEYAYPHLKICTATEIMQTFEERWGDQLPTLQGDFTEYWTDGLGSSAKETGESREVKEQLVQSEILWSMLYTDEEPEALVQEAWRNIILSTEHTWAYMRPQEQPMQNEILKRKFGYFDTAKELTEQFRSQVCAEIEDKQSEELTVFNTDLWEKSGLVTLPKETAEVYGVVCDAEGNELTCQRLTTGELVFLAEHVPGLGSKTYRLKKGVLASKGVSSGVTPTSLDNGITQVKVDPATGDVVSLLFNGEEFVNKESMSALNSYRYLEGSHTSGYAHKPTEVRIRVGEQGPLVNSLIIESAAKGCNSLRREVRLVKGSAAVEFDNCVDKQAIEAKEGIHFGFAFDIPNPQTRVNIPWGVMELEKDQLKAGNRNWIAMQRWLNVSNNEKNITWCSLNACMFENGDLTANVIGGAFKSPQWLRRIEPSATIYSWALNNHWHTNFRLSQDGKINFKYRVLPQKGAYDVVSSNRFAMNQYRPLVAVQTRKGFTQKSRLTIEAGDQVVLSNYKTVNKGKSVLLRFHSFSDKEETVSLTYTKKSPKSIYYLEAGKMEKHAGKHNLITVPAKGTVSVMINW